MNDYLKCHGHELKNDEGFTKLAMRLVFVGFILVGIIGLKVTSSE
ncbi:hypothetical protein AB1K18_25475 [Peribacillus simplex]